MSKIVQIEQETQGPSDIFRVVNTFFVSSYVEPQEDDFNSESDEDEEDEGNGNVEGD